MSWQLNFQSPATPLMEGIIDLHHDTMAILIFMFMSVSYTLGYFLYYFNSVSNKYLYNMNHHTMWEIIWTTVPVMFLIFILMPSYALLYSMDAFTWNPYVLMKAIGHQWYWSYEISCFNLPDMVFDSCLVPLEELELGDLRLLQVDSQVVLPTDLQIGFITTSDDVIHSWAVPSFGMKLDAIPGRFNYVQTYLNSEGTFYGQCSELCGLAHAYMPMQMLAVQEAYYYYFYMDSLEF